MTEYTIVIQGSGKVKKIETTASSIPAIRKKAMTVAKSVEEKSTSFNPIRVIVHHNACTVGWIKIPFYNTWEDVKTNLNYELNPDGTYKTTLYREPDRRKQSTKNPTKKYVAIIGKAKSTFTAVDAMDARKKAVAFANAKSAKTVELYNINSKTDAITILDKATRGTFDVSLSKFYDGYVKRPSYQWSGNGRVFVIHQGVVLVNKGSKYLQLEVVRW